MRRMVTPQTWVSTSLLLTNVGDLYITLLQAWNWTSVFVIVDQHSRPMSVFYQSSAAVTLEKLTVTPGLKVTVRDLPDTVEANAEMFSLLKSTSRVVLFYGDAIGLRRLLVFLAARIFQHEVFGMFTWRTPNGSADDETIRLAYQSVLLLDYAYQSDDNAAKIAEFTRTWKNLSVKQFNNSAGDNLPGLPFMLATHAGFSILGKILQEVLTKNLTTRDNLPANSFFKKTFDLDIGRVQINNMGSRLTPASVSYFNNDTGQHQVFAIAAELVDGSFEFQSRLAEPNVWFGGSSLPTNEPFCGYLGYAAACRKSAHFYVDVTLATLGVVAIVGAIATWVYRKRRYVVDRDSDWWSLNPEWLLHWRAPTGTSYLLERSCIYRSPHYNSLGSRCPNIRETSQIST
ncbi:hypothetical protein BV898_02651 [Hypsibius exemplaris]|uniref:Receptor ligand binding region domain-containing protein n=1 Tax=Hypsibius exemplaris TaxID=2072580 RepID=A0A1W0X7Z8_HYPEX|nr:hypothetical protein BV898_02651 [Hypsibius exemplaris]